MMSFSHLDQIECDQEVRCVAELHGSVWAGQSDGSLQIRDANTMAVRLTIEHYNKEFVWAITTVPNTEQVWVGYSSGYIRVYDRNGALIAEMLEHSSGIQCIACCHYTSSVFTGSNDCMVLEWDVHTFGFFRAYRGHSGPIRCMQIGVAADSGNSEVQVVLYTGSEDHSVKEWSVTSKRVHGIQVDLHCGAVLCMTIAERALWSAGEDAEIRVTELRPPYKTLAILQSAHERTITSLCAIPGTAMLVSGAVDRSIVVWDAKAMSPFRTFAGCHKGYVHTIGIVAEEVVRTITLWSTAADKSIHRWQLQMAGWDVGGAPSSGADKQRGGGRSVSPRKKLGGTPSRQLMSSAREGDAGMSQITEDIVNGYKREIQSLKSKEALFKQKIGEVQKMIETATKQSDAMKQNYNSQIRLLMENVHRKDEQIRRAKYAEKKAKDLLRSFSGKDAFLTTQLEQIIELLTDESEQPLVAGDIRSVRVSRRPSPQAPRPVTTSQRHSPSPNRSFFEKQEQTFGSSSSPQRGGHEMLPGTAVYVSPQRNHQVQPPTQPAASSIIPQTLFSPRQTPRAPTPTSPRRETTTTVPLITRKADPLPTSPRSPGSPLPSSPVAAEAPTYPISIKKLPLAPTDPSRATSPGSAPRVDPAPNPISIRKLSNSGLPPTKSDSPAQKFSTNTPPPKQPQESTNSNIASPVMSPRTPADRLAALKARIQGNEQPPVASSPVTATKPTVTAIPPPTPTTNVVAKPPGGGTSGGSADSIDKVQSEYQRILARLDQLEKEY